MALPCGGSERNSRRWQGLGRGSKLGEPPGLEMELLRGSGGVGVWWSGVSTGAQRALRGGATRRRRQGFGWGCRRKVGCGGGPGERLKGEAGPRRAGLKEGRGEILGGDCGEVLRCNTRFIKGHKPSNHIRARIKSHVYTIE